MNEAEWTAISKPEQALRQLWLATVRNEVAVSVRKCLLFAVAGCSRFANRLPDPRSRRGLEAAEAFADRQISPAQYDEACRMSSEAAEEALVVYERLLPNADRSQAYANILLTRAASFAMLDPNTQDEDGVLILSNAISASEFSIDGYENGETADDVRLTIIRDIFADAFRLRPLTIRWKSPTVVLEAKRIYDDRAFDRMPEFGLLLVESGCGEKDVLDHCNASLGHYRGCWVLDLLLARS